MFVGHFAMGFAAKAASPRVSLGTLMLAAQFVDLLWASLLLFGLEQVVIAPGITNVTAIDFTYYPFSHSLAAVIGWGFLIAGLYWIVRRSLWGAGVVGGLVVSHWVLDLIVHRADLPLYPGGLVPPHTFGSTTHLGLGLWNSLPATVLVEGLLFAGGVFLYVSVTKASGQLGRYGFWTLTAVLIGGYIALIAGPPPPSVTVVGWVGQLQWLFIVWAYWLDGQRVVRRTPSFGWPLRRVSRFRRWGGSSVPRSHENRGRGLSSDAETLPARGGDGST